MTERISQDVQNRINQIKQMGGNKKKIDSAAEFTELQKLLGNSEGASEHEKEYIQGLAIEYQKEAAEAQAKQEAEKISDGARKDLKNIKKMAGDKKELNEVEARALLDLIRNTRGDYNTAEIDYFKKELVKAGFGDLLKEIEADNSKTKQNNKNIQPEQPAEAAAETENAQQPSDSPAEPEKQPLSQADIKRARKYGSLIGEAWKGETNVTEYKFADVIIREHLNSDNFAEFMKGYNNSGAEPYFEQMLSERKDSPLISAAFAGVNVARHTAATMMEYLKNNPTEQSEKQIKILEGIMAQNNYEGENAKALDAIIKQIVE